jgi:hypothetical protein
VRGLRIKIPKDHSLWELSFQHEKEDVEITVCNRCSKQVVPHNQNDYWSANMIHNFSVGFGYGSRHDMDYWEFDLCEDCLLTFISSFELAPDGFGRDSFDEWKIKREKDLSLHQTHFSSDKFSAFADLKQMRLSKYAVGDEGAAATFVLIHNDTPHRLHVEIEISRYEQISFTTRYQVLRESSLMWEPIYTWSDEDRIGFKTQYRELLSDAQIFVESLISDFCDREPSIRLRALLGEKRIYIDSESESILNIEEEPESK